MNDLKYKQLDLPLSDSESIIIKKGKKIIIQIINTFEDSRIQRASLALSAINVLVANDPVLAALKFTNKVLKTMFPLEKKGHRICYGDGPCGLCPTHGCKVYPVDNDSTIAWCPLCLDFVPRPVTVLVFK